MNSSHPDSLTLFHDPVLRLLYHRWQGNHNMHLFRPTVEYIQGLLHELRIEYWVIDLNGLPNVGLDDQIWINNFVLPDVATLPYLQQLALVLSPNVYNQLAAESILHVGHEFLNFDVQFFSDPAAALDWLINPTNNPATPSEPMHPGMVA